MSSASLKPVARGLHERIGDVVAIGERDAVDEEVEPAVLLLDAAKTASISASFCTSSGSTSGAGVSVVGQLVDVLFEATLIGEDQRGAGRRGRLRDRPGERTLVGDADDRGRPCPRDPTCRGVSASCRRAAIRRGRFRALPPATWLPGCPARRTAVAAGRPCLGTLAVCAAAEPHWPVRRPGPALAAGRADAGRRGDSAAAVGRLADRELGHRARAAAAAALGPRQCRANQRAADRAVVAWHERCGVGILQMRRRRCRRRRRLACRWSPRGSRRCRRAGASVAVTAVGRPALAAARPPATSASSARSLVAGRASAYFGLVVWSVGKVGRARGPWRPSSTWVKSAGCVFFRRCGGTLPCLYSCSASQTTQRVCLMLSSIIATMA